MRFEAYSDTVILYPFKKSTALHLLYGIENSAHTIVLSPMARV